MKPVVLFDVMDTLVTDPFFEAIPRFFGLTLKQLLKQKHPDSWIAFEKGAISEAEYLASFFADGRPIDRDALRRMLQDEYEWLPGMQALARELSERGFEMHAVSNYSIWYEIIEAKLGISQFVPWTFVSHRTGLRKPDEACYRRVCTELDVEPERCLFIDDREVNVEAARAIGMDAILMRGAESLRRQLRERGFS